jgi:DNA-binding transcriptional LysR family regulator
MISADDLRYFLAVAKHRRLNRAADELRVDHTTVGRRISSLEHSLGQRLFDRSARGWELTPSGGLLVEPAESVAAAMAFAQDAIGRRGTLLQGRVRVACPDGFGAWLFAPAIGALSRANPDLTVEIITATGRHLPLTVRDFDVAVSLEEPTDGARVIKRHLTPFVMRLYATPEYLKSAPAVRKIDDLANHTLIWFVDRLMDVASLRAVHDALPMGMRVESTNIAAIWQAAAAGVGIAPLPVFMADPDPRLVRILPSVEFTSDYWLVLPREHANLAKTQAVARLIESMVTEQQGFITGRQKGSK